MEVCALYKLGKIAYHCVRFISGFPGTCSKPLKSEVKVNLCEHICHNMSVGKKELRNAFIKFLLWVQNVIVLDNHSVSTMLPQTRLARLSRYSFSAIGTGLLRKHVPVCTSCVLVLKLFQVFLWNYRYFPISRLHRLAFREEINVTVFSFSWTIEKCRGWKILPFVAKLRNKKITQIRVCSSYRKL